jgi:uncharacterized membrane protein
MPPENALLEKLDSISSRLDSLENRLSKIENSQSPSYIPAPPKPSMDYSFQAQEKKPIEEESFEMRVGSQWLSKIGITALVVGVSLFLINSLQYFGAAEKIMIGILVSLILIGLGHYLDTHVKKFGQVVLGGGFAILYFTIYAMHFFDNVRLVDNQAAVLVMLSLTAISFLIYALKRNLENMVYISISLVFLSANLGNIQYFSLASLVIFTAIAVFVSSLKNYRGVLFFSIIASYLTVFRWLFNNFLTDGNGVVFLVIFSFIYYLIFALATDYFFRENKEEDILDTNALVLLNSISFFGVTALSLNTRYSGNIMEMTLLAFCFLNLGISVIYQFVSKVGNLFRPYFGLGIIALFFYLPLVLDKVYLPLGWGLLALAFVIYGGLFGTIRTRTIGLAVFVFAFLSIFDLHSISDLFNGSILFYLFIFALTFECISRFYANYQLKTREGDNSESDDQLISAYSILSVGATIAFIYNLVDANMLTLSWGVAGFVIPMIGFLINDKVYRRAGLFLLLMATAKLFLIDFADLDGEIKVISFIVLGIILLAISYGYNRYKEEIKRYL